MKISLLEGFREIIKYPATRGVLKTVVFFLGESKTGNVRYVLDEIESYEWLSFKDAVSKVSFDNDKNVLKRANEFLEKRYK